MLKLFKRKKVYRVPDEKLDIEPLKISEYDFPNKGGRPRILTDGQVIQIMRWKSENISNVEIAKRLKVSEGTVRNYLRF